ncbi:MAG: porin family protein [Rhodobacteraceae bacterium]|nr:porin family protein [Paracoccaceae bacterium]
MPVLLKRLLVLSASAAATSVFLSGGAALASGPVNVTPPPAVVITSPAARDWSGFYGGLGLASVGGAITDNNLGFAFTPDMVRTTGFGAFAGYNVQRGSFVYGGELNYVNFSGEHVGFPTWVQENLLEVRARAGYAMGSVLLYGYVGAAWSTSNDGGAVFDQTGISYGLGGQMMFHGGMFVGLELGRADVSGDLAGFTQGSRIDTLSLRVGYQF